jgi:lipoprotein-releasing system permease protein
VLEGFDAELHENTARFTSHVTIAGADRVTLPHTKEIVRDLPAKFHEIASINPVIEKECLVKSETLTEGVMLRGVNSSSYASDVKNRIKSGSFDFSAGAKDIVISKRLADKMKVSVGSRVTVFTVRETSDGMEPDAARFNVTGIYSTGMAKYDDAIVFADFSTAEKLFRIDSNNSTGFEVYLKDMNRAPAMARAFTDYLGYPYYGVSMQEQGAAMFSWIELQKKPIPIVLGLISIVAVLNIITSLLLTIVEKTHSIGILRALGLKSRQIVSVFMFKGVSLTLAGSAVGCGIALLFCWLQINYGIISLDGDIYFIDKLPVRIELIHYVIVLVSSNILGLLATLAPAAVSVKITPIRAIRFK